MTKKHGTKTETEITKITFPIIILIEHHDFTIGHDSYRAALRADVIRFMGIQYGGTVFRYAHSALFYNGLAVAVRIRNGGRVARYHLFGLIVYSVYGYLKRKENNK